MRRTKEFRAAGLIAVFLGILLLCACGKEYVPMQITALKIGKADAFVLTTGEKCGIIDTGEVEDGQEILEYLQKRGITAVDWLALTHFDKDHVGGAEQLLTGIKIGRIYQPDYAGDGEAYEAYLETLFRIRREPEIISQYAEFSFGDAKVQLFPPEKAVYGEDEDNNHSLVIRIEHGQNAFLLAGDAEALRLEELMADSRIKGPYRLLKVAHHGRWNEKSQSFLEYTQPQCAWVTCSQKNPPDDEMLETLKRMGISTYLTANGDLICVSGGNTIEVSQ